MKPILFNTEMVRAILEGRKTVTRRVVKPQPPATSVVRKRSCAWDWSFWADCDMGHLMKPPYHPGDILWVRETWAKSMAGTFMYRADDKAIMVERWHPSIHMPKEAARLFLRVTDVRVERLQDITDYRAEGIHPSEACEECFAVCGGCDPLNSPTGCDNEIDAFAGLWDRTVKPADLPLYGWEANPWVFVIEFERISKDEALGGGGDAN